MCAAPPAVLDNLTLRPRALETKQVNASFLFIQPSSVSAVHSSSQLRGFFFIESSRFPCHRQEHEQRPRLVFIDRQKGSSESVSVQTIDEPSLPKCLIRWGSSHTSWLYSSNRLLFREFLKLPLPSSGVGLFRLRQKGPGEKVVGEP